MPHTIQLITARLTLRRWQPRDVAPYAAMNADSEVRAFFPATLSPEECEQEVQQFEAVFEQRGFGLYAADLRTTGEFLGFIGLMPIPEPWPRPASDPVEIGWRLKRSAWGRGLATEGARAVARHGFQQLGLPSLYSITAAINHASRRVMEKLGMEPLLEFNHPRLPEGHILSPQVLYQLGPANLPTRRPAL